MQSVEEVCDDMGLINKSRLVLQGSVSEIKQRFKGSKYGISYYANNGLEIPASLTERYGVSTHHNERAGFWEVEVLNPNQASVNEIIADFVPLGELVKFEEIIPSIQDIFIETVTKTEPVAVEA